jgi:hypothetical protein
MAAVSSSSVSDLFISKNWVNLSMGGLDKGCPTLPPVEKLIFALRLFPEFIPIRGK